ncbi:class II glutamine amidotransferase [Pantoea sp. SM3640]|uniref:class II glutamine amidotransferase n=1 Tax=Pantoea sp. SM3640 TaxID=2787629 RepID=UPI0018A74245|nr:class II glutamine amidotransferase [Pantoea sp. SM3640]QPG27117.1 class II glutamine amidotransferase [Pantoea sp. SM3640]
MCRMILAHGQFDSAQILEAARAMSCGEGAEHDGPIKSHPNGWGCLWLEEGEIRTLHGTGPFADALPGIDVDRLRSRFLAVHVRHATLSKNQGIEFSHPLWRNSAGHQWYMMHNGFLPTIYRQLGLAESRFDSEEYLRYLVDQTTPADFTRDYLRAKMAQVEPGGSAGNAIFVTRDKAWAWQWHPHDTPFPDYFTMHFRQQDGCTLIASEPVTIPGSAGSWRRMINHELYEIPFRE